MKFVLLATTAAAALTAGSVSAQEFYAGLGFENIDSSFGGSDFGSTEAVSVIAGYRSPMGANAFWGAELDGSMASDTTYIDQVMRLKGIAGYNFGRVSGFASVGVAQQTGFFAESVTSGDSIDGYSFGIGADIPVSGRMKVRVEAIQDRFDSSGKVWENNTLRAAALFSF